MGCINGCIPFSGNLPPAKFDILQSKNYPINFLPASTIRYNIWQHLVLQVTGKGDGHLRADAGIFDFDACFERDGRQLAG